MKLLDCATTLERLEAFHDRELSVVDEIAVRGHVECCSSCSARLHDLQAVRSALRLWSDVGPLVSPDQARGLQLSVIGRVRAEQDASFPARVRAMFDDWHLVYAGLGAVVASLACVAIVLGMTRLAGEDRADSLAGMVSMLASPGSNENPMRPSGHMLLPRTLHEAFTSSTSESTGEAMVMLAAVVTREGRVSNVELIGSKWVGTENGEADVLDAVSKARFEPARQDGLPVAVNMVWMMTHTTVRATADAPARGRTTARRRTA